ERNKIALKIADLQDGPLEDPDGAVDTLEAMLGEIPDDRAAALMHEQTAEKRPSPRPRILSILRPIYERASNTRRIVEIDEWQLGHTSDPVARQDLYFEIAGLLAKSQETAQAGLGGPLR